MLRVFSSFLGGTKRLRGSQINHKSLKIQYKNIELCGLIAGCENGGENAVPVCANSGAR